MYTVDDLILAATHKSKDRYTEMFSHLEKYKITKKFNIDDKMFYNGDIVFSKPSKGSYQLMHCFTIHSIQGETAENNLFIDISKRFSAHMLYTALSRAQYISQIYLVNAPQTNTNTSHVL